MTTDITGTSIAIVNGTVVAIQGQPVSSTPPTTGQVLVWNGTQYIPTDFTIFDIAGGDLDGYYPNPTVSILSNLETSSLKTSNYTISVNDYIICIGTLSTLITITLPASPNTGSSYIIKDVNGTCGLPFRVSVSGNGANIDGFGNSFYMASPYESKTFVYTGSQWSII